MTLGRDLEKLSRIISAFRDGGGEGKPVHIKVDVCWNEDAATAQEEAHRHWRFPCLESDAHHDLASPEDFEAASATISPQDMHRHVLIASDPTAYIEHLRACEELGASAIDVHHVGQDQRVFIGMFERDVLPALRLG